MLRLTYEFVPFACVYVWDVYNNRKYAEPIYIDLSHMKSTLDEFGIPTKINVWSPSRYRQYAENPDKSYEKRGWRCLLIRFHPEVEKGEIHFVESNWNDTLY